MVAQLKRDDRPEREDRSRIVSSDLTLYGANGRESITRLGISCLENMAHDLAGWAYIEVSFYIREVDK
jgi:hypothetical protein